MAKAKKRRRLPIEYWSYSSLMAYLRNPLTWYKRYVEKVYDLPRTPASVVGSAGHTALEQYYLEMQAGRKPDKDAAIAAGLRYLRGVSDFELNFGAANTKAAQKKKRASMEREYLQTIGYYLARPPRWKVVGVEVRGMADHDHLPIALKSIADLVVESSIEPGALDIVDHKFVDSFSKGGIGKALFLAQAIFNYYVMTKQYGRPVRRFVVVECKKTKNADGRAQIRRYALDYTSDAAKEAFIVMDRLIHEATEELMIGRKYLPNPSDMFEGEHSFDLYRLNLVSGEED